MRPFIEREIDEELAFHRERTIAELVARGATRDEAEAEARRRFGPEGRHRRRILRLDLRRIASERRRSGMHVVATGLRAALHGARRTPAFTAAVAAILTLGLGVNAVTYGLVDRLVLAGPRGIREPDALRRLVLHRHGDGGAETVQTDLSYSDYRDLLSARQLEGVAAESSSPLLFGGGATAERVQALFVSANYFPLLGTTASAGRFFTDRDSARDGSRLVVLGHAFWQRRFGGDPGAIGQVVAIEAHRYTIVGVAAKDFTGTAVRRVDLFLPIEAAADEQVAGPWRTSRRFSWLGVVVRLRSRANDAGAAAEMTAIYRQGQTGVPGADPGARLDAAPLNAIRGVTASREVSIAALVGGMAIVVLVIAFANTANLFLARALRRQHQVAVRLALGGGRLRLIGEQAVEGAVVSLCGAAAALLVATFAARPLQERLFPDVAWLDTNVDWTLLLLVGSLAVIGGAVAAGFPMWRAGRVDLVRSLHAGSQRVARGRTRTQTVMLVAQSALSVLLLVGAALFVRSLQRAQAIDIGVDADRLLVVGMLEGDTAPRPDLLAALRQALDRVPGVERTTVTAGTIPFTSSWAEHLAVPGLPDRPTVEDGGPYIAAVEPGYFAAAGTPIVEGRGFTSADRSGAPRVAVVSRTMARLYWPGQTAIGKCLQIGRDLPTCTIVVGIARDVRRQNLVQADTLLYYIPLEQASRGLQQIGRLVVRAASADPDTLARIADRLRREAWRLDPGLRYVMARPMDELVAPQLRSWRLGAVLFSAFGTLALLVAAVGLYSVLAFDVEGRRREIGVRAALGASAPAIVRQVVLAGVRIATTGIVCGVGLAILLSPFLEGLLYEVRPDDPRILASVSLLLAIVAVCASGIPAARAAHIDPGRSLRDD